MRFASLGESGGSDSSSDRVTSAGGEDWALGRRRLVVAHRDFLTDVDRAVGFLDQCSDGTYEFAYIRRAVAAPGFVALIGFSDPSVRSSNWH